MATAGSRLRVDDGSVLTVSLMDDDARGPERAQLVPADERGELQVADMFIW
jgi:hypothetical protein